MRAASRTPVGVAVESVLWSVMCSPFHVGSKGGRAPIASAERLGADGRPLQNHADLCGLVVVMPGEDRVELGQVGAAGVAAELTSERTALGSAGAPRGVGL